MRVSEIGLYNNLRHFLELFDRVLLPDTTIIATNLSCELRMVRVEQTFFKLPLTASLNETITEQDKERQYGIQELYIWSKIS